MPGVMQAVQVSKTPIRVQSLLIQNDTVMLINPDITNNIFIGNDPGSQVIPVPPLGSVTLDTKKHDLWLSTNGGAFIVNAYLMPNGSNWVPSPAQVAAQINALGLAKDTTVVGVNNSLVFGTTPAVQQLGGVAGQSVATDMLNANKGVTTEISSLIATGLPGGTPGGVPVLRGTANLGNGSAQTLAGVNTAILLSSVAVNKPSFEAVFQLSIPAGVGTIPFALLAINWEDSNSGLSVGFKQYALTAGNGIANALFFYLSGPCRGNRVSITLFNVDPAQTLTYTWAFNLTSHIYTVDRLLQPSYLGVAPIGFTNPAGNPSKGLLFSSAPNIGPNGSILRLSAASNAKCKLNIDDSGQANNWALIIQDPATLYDASASSELYKFNGVAGSTLTTEIQMPNGPALFNLQNSQAANTINLKVTALIMEY